MRWNARGKFPTYDEYTDVSDRQAASKMAGIVMDVLRNPTKARHSDHFLGEFTRQFWTRALALSTPNAPCIQHFIDGFEEYTTAVAFEAEDRTNKSVRTVWEYLLLRRGTSSSKSIFALIEFGLDLPDYVLSHPIVSNLTTTAADLCAITNDLHSYSLEHARGLDGHNIITSIMSEHNLDLQSALDWLGSLMDGLVARFLSDMKRLPSWNETIDANLKLYIDSLGHWVRGNESWCYESKRYYGELGSHVRKTQLIQLRNPERGYLEKSGFDHPEKTNMIRSHGFYMALLFISFITTLLIHRSAFQFAAI